MTKTQMSNNKREMIETFKDVFKTNRFKRLEFHEKGTNENIIFDFIF